MNFSIPEGRNYILLASLIAITLSVFFFSLGNGFVYDDHVFVTENKYIQNPVNPFSFFVDKAAYSGERDFFIYRPLSALSYALDYAFWRLSAFGFHLTNIIWHIFNVLLVFFLCQELLGSRLKGWLAALLFAVHPVQVESVCWIAQRSNLLCLFFVLSTVLLYRKPNTRSLALLSYALALMAKETGVVVLFLLPLLDYYVSPDNGSSLLKWRKKFLPYVLITLLYVVLRVSVIGQLSQRLYWGGNIFSTALTMSKAFFYYMKLIFFPIQLSIDHVFPVVNSLSEPLVWIGLSILVILIGVIIFVRKTYKVIAFGIMWFLIGLLPVSNIIPVQALLAERFLYIPLVGLCVVLVSLIPLKKKYLFLSGAVLLLLSVRTIARTLDWKSDFTLWQAATQATPDSPRAHYALGNIWYSQNEYQQAIKEYEEAIGLNHKVADIYNQLGLSYEGVGNFEQALLIYQRGLEVPQLNENVKMNILTNIGNIYFRTGHFDKARSYYEQALTLDSSVIGLRYNLAKTYFYCGELPRAEEEINKVLSVAPDFMETKLWHKKIHSEQEVAGKQ